MLLGKAGKSHILWTEPSRHVLRKTTWNFVLPSDSSVHGTMTKCQALSRKRFSCYQGSRKHVTLLSTSDGYGFSFMVSILGETSWVWSSRSYSTCSWLAYPRWRRTQKKMWCSLRWHEQQVQEVQPFLCQQGPLDILRHSKKTYLFNESGTVNLRSTEPELDKINPVQLRMTAQDVAACCCAMTRPDSRLTSLSTGLGSHLDFHQHNHGRSELVQIKDIQTKS